jgi:hypothetical protein
MRKLQLDLSTFTTFSLSIPRIQLSLTPKIYHPKSKLEKEKEEKEEIEEELEALLKKVEDEHSYDEEQHESRISFLF